MRKAATAVATATVAALLSLSCFAIPMYVIRPFRAQGPNEFPFALAVRHAGPVVAAACALIACAALVMAWRRARMGARFGLMVCLILAATGAVMTRINVFEKMFHPYGSAAFGYPNSVSLNNHEMVLSVSEGGETHAYPVGAMGYHHVVNDVVGSVPVVATYCTLCHTGIVWRRTVNGQVLTFRLCGIRNGNALLLDEETGSIWQQTTGTAIFGPLKGNRLQLIHSDELSYSLWRAEQPRGMVLKPNRQYAASYEKIGWEESIEKLPSVIDTGKTGIKPRALMLGIESASGSKAFPWPAVLSAGLVQDSVGTEPILLVVGPDKLSVRAFRTQANATFLRVDSKGDVIMTDAETSSVWNFSGCAITGPLAGRCLSPIEVKKDYWFDWLNYHPKTAVFSRAGQIRAIHSRLTTGGLPNRDCGSPA